MMNQAFQIARLWGIPVRLHWTFLLLFVALGMLASGREDAGPYFLWSSLMVLVIFLCVVLHEFGHALTARRFGVRTVDIILSPIGGIARLDRLPPKPIEEFLVAIAGPLVNVAIAALVYVVIWLSGMDLTQGLLALLGPDMQEDSGFSFAGSFLPAILFLNITLAVFNLLPAFPMDGGRILRALLSIRLGRLRATRIAATIGQILAVGLILFGLWQFSIITALIGGFIFITAMREYQGVRMDERLQRARVAELFRPLGTGTLRASAPVVEAADQMRRNISHNFLVLDDAGELYGALVGAAVLAAAKDGALEQPVTAYCHTAGPPLSLKATLYDAWQHMQAPGCAILPVRDEAGRLLGSLDVHSIQHFLQTG
jgi:Zn-dependent protease